MITATAPAIPSAPTHTAAGTTVPAIRNCDACGEALTPNARFCGACGQATTTGASPRQGSARPDTPSAALPGFRPRSPSVQPPRPAPPRPVSPFGTNRSGSGLGGGLGLASGGPTASAEIAATPPEAIGRVEELLRNRGAQVRRITAESVQFDLEERHLLNALIQVPLQGTATARAGVVGAQVDLRLGVNWGAATTFLAINAVCMLLWLGMFGAAGLMLGACAGALQAYLSGVAYPKSVASRIAGQLSQTTPSAVQAGSSRPGRPRVPNRPGRSTGSVPPPPVPTHRSAPEATPHHRQRLEEQSPRQAADSADSVFEQIGRLASLRDAGALEEAEFQKKKVELLARV